uniref:Uncharacterized protein n=1 Tax=Anguilla anguilla TaxID=7936 RepID=A0A0E9VJ95_ANGAN
MRVGRKNSCAKWAVVIRTAQ